MRESRRKPVDIVAMFDIDIASGRTQIAAGSRTVLGIAQVSLGRVYVYL